MKVVKQGQHVIAGEFILNELEGHLGVEAKDVGVEFGMGEPDVDGREQLFTIRIAFRLCFYHPRLN